ncbi:MAG: hypothetical protein ABIY50_09955, partial [Ignavibacteria bacterium]
MTKYYLWEAAHFFHLNGIVIGEGTGIFIGRRVFSSDGKALEIVGGSTKGYIKCNEMISEGTDSSVSTLGLNDSNDQITIDVNYI